MNISRDTRLIDLTVGQLEDYIKTLVATSTAVAQKKEFVYGIEGIQSLFGCSKSKAQRLKDGAIKEAVSQNGRTIVVDADLARRLFNLNTQKNGI